MSIFKRKRKDPKFKNGMRIQPANYSSSFMWAIRNDSYAKAAFKREKERADLANWKFPDNGWHRPKRPQFQMEIEIWNDLNTSIIRHVNAGLLGVNQAHALIAPKDNKSRETVQRQDDSVPNDPNDSDKLDGDNGETQQPDNGDSKTDNGDLTYQTPPSSSSLSRELVQSYAIMEQSIYGHKQIRISIADLQYYQCSCGHFNPLPCPTHLIRPIQMIYR